MPDRRSEFVKKWYGRGLKESDPFDQFFCFWIALAVAAAQWSTLQGNSPNDGTDRDKVIRYLTGHEEFVAGVLSSSPQLKCLAARIGSTHRNPILDTGKPELRGKFQRFADHYADCQRLDRGELVETLGEILNKVRNNVFHGRKIYDEEDDIKVLTLVNPILKELLQVSEPGINN